MIHSVLDKYPNWLLRVILLGVVLDLAISVVLGVTVWGVNTNAIRLAHETAAAHCWDRILDEAITNKQTPAEHTHLLFMAQRCALLIP